MKKRVLPLLLALLLLLPTALTACSESTENAEADPSAAESESAELSETEAEEETEFSRAMVKDDLPEDLTLEGQSFVILGRNKSWFEGELYVEDINGEALNDAVFNRDTTVEERLNCTINYLLEGDTNSLVNTSVKAGSDDYSLHVGSAVDTVQYGIAGNYYNLLGEYPVYLNLEQPWWSQYYTEQGSIAGKSFFATGDLFFSLTKLSFVTFVNLNMLEDLGFDKPYDLVRDGKWTFDKEMEMAESAYIDKNGNQEKDKADAFGMSMGGQIGLDVYWSAFDLSIMKKDENDVPTFNVNEERMSSVIEKLFSYYIDRDFVYTPANDSDLEQDQIAEMLSEDRMLFSPLRIMHTDALRDMESDYGLIPLPKWNEEQSNYYTFVHDQYSIAGIPLSVQDPASVSAVFEALASESYRYVTPAYYDLVLNGKYLRDLDSSEMLEIAMAGIKIDFGWIHTYSLTSCSQALLRDVIYQQTSNRFSSTFAMNKKVISKALERLVKSVEKIDN